MPLLSILICTITERAQRLEKLMTLLSPQLDSKVEVLTCSDNRERTIGNKRNELVGRAGGDYVCFIDDDDLVAHNYVEKIRAALLGRPDCVGMEGIITFNGVNPKKFIHTIRCDEWCEKDGVYWRSPNHLNPIRRDLALQVPFPLSSFGEDHDFSKRIKPLLNSESYIEGPIYYYFYEPK